MSRKNEFAMYIAGKLMDATVSNDEQGVSQDTWNLCMEQGRIAADAVLELLSVRSEEELQTLLNERNGLREEADASKEANSN